MVILSVTCKPQHYAEFYTQSEVILSVTMLSVIVLNAVVLCEAKLTVICRGLCWCAKSQYCYYHFCNAECRYTEFHYAECHNVVYRIADCNYVDCRIQSYAECPYAECH
jgi:hypothetical protein